MDSSYAIVLEERLPDRNVGFGKLSLLTSQEGLCLSGGGWMPPIESRRVEISPTMGGWENSMPSYLRLTLQQLAYLSDGEFVLLSGQYFRHIAGDHLEQGDRRLVLLGLPFSWLPPQGAPVDIWGRLIRGQHLSLHIHDARPRGTHGDVPELLPPTSAGQDLVLMVRVIDIGDSQLALTADGLAYVLVGDELDARTYCVHGHLLTLNPPTLAVVLAIPVMFPTPMAGPLR